MNLDYESTITLLSAWITVTLTLTIVMMLSRGDKEGKDYGVILLLGSVDVVFAMIWLRRVFTWPPHFVIPTFVVMALSSTALMVWVGERLWHERH